MNLKLVLEALKCYRDRLNEQGDLGGLLRAKFCDLEVDELQRPAPMPKSGQHLAIMRDWMQRRCVGGDEYQWGSNSQFITLYGETVADMEHLAQRIAQAAVEDFKSK